MQLRMRSNPRIAALVVLTALMTAPIASAAGAPGLIAGGPGPTVRVDVQVPSPVNFIAEQAASDVEAFWLQRLPGFVAPTLYAALPAALPGHVCLSQLSIARFCSGEIAWDVPDLERIDADGGALAVATVIAHEMGHQIQAFRGAAASELGADCMAGAYLTSIADGQSPRFTGTPEEVDAAVFSTFSTTPADTVPARVAAFAAGRGGTADGCLAAYPE